jgi:prophage maintenance system killer protein
MGLENATLAGACGLHPDGLFNFTHFNFEKLGDTWGIVRNHPFIDGNKRTGFVVGVLFLELNGFRFNASEEDAAQMVLELASGDLDEAAYIAFVRAHASLGKK